VVFSLPHVTDATAWDLVDLFYADEETVLDDDDDADLPVTSGYAAP
jgi:hypothetical protein